MSTAAIPRRSRPQSGVVALVLLAMTGLLAGLLLVAPRAEAAAPTARTTWSLTSPLARETVRKGAQDVDVYHIAHVRELQRRLARLGLYRSTIDGVYGRVTARAVRAFKKRAGLPVTTTVGHVAWAKLIRSTTHVKVPKRCRAKGWHMCLDRFHHEATLFHKGVLYNSWLVRMGSKSHPTRLGTHAVYWRDIDHVSTLYNTPMPYSQFFDGGQALHGSVLMMDPYVGHSHGCVNFYLEDARQLWRLTSTRRLVVTVHGAWD
ncbi:MAG TPA: L,D-transpeptidase family protein [Marmoricola sp.]|nr:L,D-transpeptidase family protein [Marmoricola sp.]